jgi:DNA mismatch repair protein MutS
VAGSSLRFTSILFQHPGDAARVGSADEPGFFGDLNLDQLVAAMTAGREEYQLDRLFYTPLHDEAAVTYRHQVLRDLEQHPVAAAVRAFAGRMRDMREQLTQARKLHYRYQQEWWFLAAVDTYCEAVSVLAGDLSRLEVTSPGFLGLRDYLSRYLSSAAFTGLVSGSQALHEDFAGVTYSVHIRGNRVRVSKYEGEPDYSTDVEKTFAKFRQGAVKDYRVAFRDPPDMNHVEAQVLDLVARLFPEVFQRLDDYYARHQDYLDAVVAGFDRESQFCLAYLELIEPLRQAGLPFCYPGVCAARDGASVQDERVDESYDLVLAAKLAPEKSPVVCNGYFLTGPERIIVVTGPNNGGKTTFARMFGQLHYLASLGLPVPGRDAQLSLPDQIFTHFEREEDITTLRGKLEDELTRIHQIMQQATSRSVLVMNESFTSTTLHDALLVGTEVMRRISELGVLCVYVTFVDELASLNETTVSMVSAIVPENPAERTYKITRRPADGLAYAAAIAAKYGLTYEQVKERIGS